ncbi:hypothetical protein FSO04_22335 [Paraburkholderia madseniana]|uniref:Uncharacterized protein n=1 Tax=Paraburkholderia madseniana TaxID=2599607 RepID=A0A6N6WDC5_9BURK|nr:hypothetical protein [Paraburkholderia madseniana]KAE8757784.1 hypothetical protein FSO04_22335 [Paraburkholderia madseniana]NPT66058.1 hypothetical protein [Paraburkholderia madseniana]
MRPFAEVVVSFAPPPLMVAIVFSVAYLLVGIPVHFTRGAAARDWLGTLAGIFAALAYIVLVVGFYPGVQTAAR